MGTTAEQIVAKIEAALLSNPLADQISLDGHSIALSRALEKLQYWRRRVACEQGARPACAGVDLRNC